MKQLDKVIICPHPDRPYRAKGLCYPCYSHSRYIANKGKHIARRKEWIRKNKERIKHNHAKWDLLAMPYIKRHYGLTAKEYIKLLEDQQNCCAICGRNRNMFKRKLAVDHNHLTKQTRGLLCCTCNTGIGNLKDDPILIKKALAYLEKYAQ